MSSRIKENTSTLPLLQECLAVKFVFKKKPAIAKPNSRDVNNQHDAPRGSPVLARESPDDNYVNGVIENDCGYNIFGDFVRQNQQCFWNQCLVQTVSNLDYAGHIGKNIILVSGSPYSLEVVRSAWARRVLRPPMGYDIECIGDVDRVDMGLIPQTQFAPLSESLCKAVLELNTERKTATIDVISRSLEINFPKMIVPNNEILYKTLGKLIKERKVYHTGKGYFVVSPSTYRAKVEAKGTAGFQTERQMLMTNEEAIEKLYPVDSLDGKEMNGSETGRSRCIQTEQSDILNASKWGTTDKVLFPTLRTNSSDNLTKSESSSPPKLERSHSLRLLRLKDKNKLNRSNSFKAATSTSDSKSDSENLDGKREKRSVFSRLFRRSHSRDEKQSRKEQMKRQTFAAQFPPPEWSDADSIHLHSQGTQTPNADFYTPRVRSSSVGRVNSHDRYSLHLHSSTCSLRASDRQHQHRCDSDPSLRLKSASLPRRSYPSVDLESGSSPSRHASTATPTIPGTPNSKRSYRSSSSPRRHSTDRYHARTSPAHREKLNNGGTPPQANGKINRETNFNIRNNHDGSWDYPTLRREDQETELKEPFSNHWSRSGPEILGPNLILRTPTKKSNQKIEEMQKKTASQEQLDPPVIKEELKEKQLDSNDSIDLEVSLKTSHSPHKTGKSETGENELSKPSPDNRNNKDVSRTTMTTGNISIKAGGRSSRPVSITTVTSITTSLSQGALKDVGKNPQSVPKSRSSDNSPLYSNKINEKLCFSPVKSKLTSNKCDLLKDSGADDSGFLSVSPV